MASVATSTKNNVLGILVDAVDYGTAVSRIIEAAEEGRPFAATALAVHGVMTGVHDREHRFRLNNLDLVTPDGQPVRWALNILHRKGLKDRVYGPTLTLRLCRVAAEKNLPIFLYGSSQEVLAALATNLSRSFPGLVVAGAEASKFRRTTRAEKLEIAARIRASGAKITFVGLGCPRQEVFAFEYRESLGMPLIAVGAAYDYHSGSLRQPPMWIQRSGLQWLFRLLQEPQRLWRRYLLLNPAYVGLVTLQAVRLWRPNPVGAPPKHELLYG